MVNDGTHDVETNVTELERRVLRSTSELRGWARGLIDLADELEEYAEASARREEDT